MRRPDVILVNGPSSAGKTTLCRALQAAIEEPYLVTAFDDFVFMAAPRYFRGADTAHQNEHDLYTALGVEMVTTSPPGAPPAVTARFGPVFRRILDAMAPAVRALVDGGNAVIFDHVLHDRAMQEIARVLKLGGDFVCQTTLGPRKPPAYVRLADRLLKFGYFYLDDLKDRLGRFNFNLIAEERLNINYIFKAAKTG